ncbi:hypothetical protein P7C71_g5283, partial [Lecanoromycetidae sp. Uapishka_2]
MSSKTKSHRTDPTQQAQSPGLLPTSQVNVQTASKPQSEYFNAIAGGHLWSSQLAGHHDAAYYEKWNKDRQEAIARGEDPNAKFLALVAEREQHSRVGKLRKLFGKRKEGKKAHGQGLTEEEEREALERDQAWARGR